MKTRFGFIALVVFLAVGARGQDSQAVETAAQVNARMSQVEDQWLSEFFPFLAQSLRFGLAINRDWEKLPPDVAIKRAEFSYFLSLSIRTHVNLLRQGVLEWDPDSRRYKFALSGKTPNSQQVIAFHRYRDAIRSMQYQCAGVVDYIAKNQGPEIPGSLQKAFDDFSAVNKDYEEKARPLQEQIQGTEYESPWDLWGLSPVDNDKEAGEAGSR